VARLAPVLEARVPVMVPRRVMEPQVLAMTPRRVRKPRMPMLVPRVRAGEGLAELPQAPAEVALEAVSATRRPPVRVCRSSISP
jgi:hypothetical protein